MFNDQRVKRLVIQKNMHWSKCAEWPDSRPVPGWNLATKSTRLPSCNGDWHGGFLGHRGYPELSFIYRWDFPWNWIFHYKPSIWGYPRWWKPLKLQTDWATTGACWRVSGLGPLWLPAWSHKSLKTRLSACKSVDIDIALHKSRYSKRNGKNITSP